MNSYYIDELNKTAEEVRRWYKKHLEIVLSVAGTLVVVFVGLFIYLSIGQPYANSPITSPVPQKFNNGTGDSTKTLSPYDDPKQLTAVRFAAVIGGFRIEDGIHALIEVPELDAAARNHAYDMQVNNYSSSTSPNGITDRQRISNAIVGATYTGSYWDNICSNATITSEDSKLFESKYESMLVDPRYDYYGVGIVANTAPPGKCNGYIVIYFASVH